MYDMIMEFHAPTIWHYINAALRLVYIDARHRQSVVYKCRED